MGCITQEVLNKTKASLQAALDAEAALMAGTIQSYTLDTGQTKQTVTKFNVTELRNYIDSLLNRCVTLEARLNGTGSQIARPDF